MNNPTICTCCKKELTGGIDTFGTIDAPMCWTCHSELTFNEGDPSPLAMWEGLQQAAALEFPEDDIRILALQAHLDAAAEVLQVFAQFAKIKAHEDEHITISVPLSACKEARRLLGGSFRDLSNSEDIPV